MTTTRQTDAPLVHQKIKNSPRRADAVADLARNGELMLAPSWQRGSVWTEDQRIALVRSFVLGLTVPGIIVNDRHAAGHPGFDVEKDDAYWVLVDGRQRVETMMAWFHGDLAVPASWFPEKDVVEVVWTDDGPYVTHDRLVRPVQLDQSLGWVFNVSEGRFGSDSEEASVYLLLNTGGTAHRDEDLARAAAIASAGSS